MDDVNGGTQNRPWWAPPDVDCQRPSASRMYDFLLGGCHNFAADRELVRQVVDAEPNAPRYARVNRSFLRRAVQFLLAEGIRQFLDVGSGVPTVGNVHEVAQCAVPDARVVYVDIDPVAVAHSKLILENNTHAGVVQADLREVDVILTDPVVRRLIDLNEPVAVLLVAVLHFVPESAAPGSIVTRFRDAVSSGSFLVVSHASTPTEQTSLAVHEAYAQTTTPLTLRSPAEIEALFAGFDVVEPGVCRVGSWRADPESLEEPGEVGDPVPGFAGVGKKP